MTPSALARGWRAARRLLPRLMWPPQSQLDDNLNKYLLDCKDWSSSRGLPPLAAASPAS